MAQVTIPDELAQRVKSQLQANDEDLNAFAARALTNELLSIDEDPIAQAELMRLTLQGKSEIEAGQGVEGLQAMRQLAAEKGIKFTR